MHGVVKFPQPLPWKPPTNKSIEIPQIIRYKSGNINGRPAQNIFYRTCDVPRRETKFV